MGDLYGLWNEIWGECPTTTDLEHGLDTADSEFVAVTSRTSEANPLKKKNNLRLQMNLAASYC